MRAEDPGRIYSLQAAAPCSKPAYLPKVLSCAATAAAHQPVTPSTSLAPKPALSCVWRSQNKSLALDQMGDLQHKAAMHMALAKSQLNTFTPKTLTPRLLFPANHLHDLTSAPEFLFYAVFERTCSNNSSQARDNAD